MGCRLWQLPSLVWLMAAAALTFLVMAALVGQVANVAAKVGSLQCWV